MPTLTQLLLCCSLTLCAVPSYAGQPEPPVELTPEQKQAERHRLAGELQNLARRNAWTGVERMYVELEALGLPLDLATHLMGAQAALSRGEVLVAKTRLQVGRAVATQDMDPNSSYQEVQRSLNSLDENYGMVHIRVAEGRIPALVKFETPFSTQEKQAVAFAREKVSSAHAFMGLLPIGRYMIDGQTFEVTTEKKTLEVRVGA